MDGPDGHLNLAVRATSRPGHAYASPVRYAAITALAGLVLAGCGGGSPKMAPTTPPATSTSPTASPTPTTSPLPGERAGAGTITGVVFTGSPAKPTVTVTGTGLGSLPAANPSYTPEGHPACPLPPKGDQGHDYGVSFWLADTAHNWSGGRYRPELNELDCIGLISSAFTATSVVFTFGSAYTDYPQNYRLAEGDAFQLVVNGAAFQGSVHYTA